MLYLIEFVSIIQSLPFNLPTESINGIVVIVFTTVAAIISVLLDRRKKRSRMGSKVITDPDGTTRLMERVFDELQKTTELLRYENQQLMTHNDKLTNSIQECQAKYNQQLRDSANLLEDVRHHKETIEKLNKKIDSLLKAVGDILGEDNFLGVDVDNS